VKARYLAAIALVAALAIAGCGSNKSSSSGQQTQSGGNKTLTVWLMSGSAPDAVVSGLNAEFTAAHPGVKVSYQKQVWDGILDKLTTALASNNPPDVIELGNTQAANFTSKGALADLTSKVTDLGGSTWLTGLKDSGAWDGKQYAVPFYAGDRVVIYRTDLFKQAGITSPPTSIDQWIADGKKLAAASKSNSKFVPLYLPGQNWYFLLSLIHDQGGDVAANDGGTWKGTVNSPQAQAGIALYQKLFQQLSTPSIAGTDEATPQQGEVMGKGNVGMIVGNLWEIGVVTQAGPKLKDKIGVFPIPSATAGKTAPVFLGGSDLAIPAGSKNQDLAYDYIKRLTSEKYQDRLAKENGAIPNSTSFAAATSGNPTLSVGTKAAENSFMTPVTPAWAAVEATPNPLKDMLSKILSGKASIQQASTEASNLITQKLASG
jgi:N,N'-diacetylchitobiose transport system substrate-binding protein